MGNHNSKSSSSKGKAVADTESISSYIDVPRTPGSIGTTQQLSSPRVATTTSTIEPILLNDLFTISTLPKAKGHTGGLAEIRILNELHDFRNQQSNNTYPGLHVSLAPMHGAGEKPNLFQLLGTIEGPQGTPYEGGLFRVGIVLPDTYPLAGPRRCIVLTPMTLGGRRSTVAGDKRRFRDWTPTMKIVDCLLRLQSELADMTVLKSSCAGKGERAQRDAHNVVAMWTRNHAGVESTREWEKQKPGVKRDWGGVVDYWGGMVVEDCLRPPPSLSST